MAAANSCLPVSKMAALSIFVRSNLAALSNPVAQLSRNRSAPQIQQRWGSYRSSLKYTIPEDYTDYEITKDPNEWKYVECALGYKVIPKPMIEDTKHPSGYKPATAVPTDYPYFVERTKNYMQPVYLNRNPRGTKKITKISKIQGDIWALERDMKQYIEEQTGKKIASQIHEFAGVIKFKDGSSFVQL
ncbi:probable 39S ribosomal protein L49, mitochondrial isoform X2 [Monomorium pharaonis]|uniref:probable 39S ribosomal protein L49, mitochondrial isoform X2 n=1 Tax=Monomorium pharaonis TaxID=307658 RepID=UPI001747AAF1|nr:probable 39S ribosomal protein L49, mitochondrial isoform X2 [Monomorium pharaonis]